MRHEPHLGMSILVKTSEAIQMSWASRVLRRTDEADKLRNRALLHYAAARTCPQCGLKRTLWPRATSCRTLPLCQVTVVKLPTCARSGRFRDVKCIAYWCISYAAFARQQKFDL